MKTNAFYKLFLLAVISSFLSTHLDAQGKIFRLDQLAKRRADIASGTAVRNMKKGNRLMYEDHGVTSGFVMRNTGQLQVYYAYANRLDRELPANAALRAHFVKGDSTRSDSLIPRFPNVPPPWPRYLYNDCYGTFQYRYEYDYTNTGSPESVYLANLGHVTQGDTVQFYYFSDNIQTGDSVIYGIYSADTVGTAWNVIFGNVDYCIYDYSDVLNVYIGVSPEIMLGETKYYQAMPDPADATKLTFKEMSETSGWTPGGQPAQFTVTAVTPTTTLGAYYEYRDNDGLALAGDMIRLIGRYWKHDTTYSIRLSATSGARTGSIEIKVKKPVRLLTPGQSPTYEKTLDVFNNERNIDSICIYYGGKYGIPPQFLKGQMLKEAGTIDYAGGKGFAPSYRYEPFSKYAQLSEAWKTDDRYNGGLWVVDPNRTGHEMGTGKDVPIHQNVCDMPYPRSPKTVWDILYDNSELVNTGSSKEHKVYGKRLPSGKMVFPSPYKSICRKYNEFLNSNGSLASLFSSKSKEEIAREKMIEYLRDEWEGGAKKMVAQTRLASSYGLLQMMYSTAVETEEMGYPSRDHNISPEDFNVTDTNMTYSMKYMKWLLQNALTPTIEESGNWPNGFEYWFKCYIWPMWNTGTTYKGVEYSRNVYTYTQWFLPQKN